MASPGKERKAEESREREKAGGAYRAATAAYQLGEEASTAQRRDAPAQPFIQRFQRQR